MKFKSKKPGKAVHEDHVTERKPGEEIIRAEDATAHEHQQAVAAEPVAKTIDVLPQHSLYLTKPSESTIN